MTKRELEQLQVLSAEIVDEKKRLVELKARTGGRAAIITDMPRGWRVNDTTGRYATEIVSLQEKIKCSMERYWREANKIRGFIDSIDDSRMRLILTLKYMDGLSWHQVAVKMGGIRSEANLHKLHNAFWERQADE